MASRILCLLLLGVTASVSYAQSKCESREAMSANELKKMTARAESDAHAQTEVGFTYQCKGDDAEAASWYRKAADRGDAAAQYNLGVAYDTGQGVPRDPIQAYKWYDVAAARFPASAADNRAQAARSRDLVAAKMTPPQIAEAQKLAKEWSPR